MGECDELSDSDIVEKFYDLVVYDPNEDFDEQLSQLISSDMSSDGECTSDSNSAETTSIDVKAYRLKMKVKRSKLVGSKRKKSSHHRKSTSSITEEQESEKSSQLRKTGSSTTEERESDTNISLSSLDSNRSAHGSSSAIPTSDSTPQKKFKSEESSSPNSCAMPAPRRSLPIKFIRHHHTQESRLARPLFRNHQLLGDSQFLRFAEQILHMRVFTRDPRQINYCVSGQRIRDLQLSLAKKEYPIHKNVIVLIGTNDIVYHTGLAAMVSNYQILLDCLKQEASRIVLVTIPPVARYENDETHWKILINFNKYILSLQNVEEQIFVVDAGKMYLDYSNTANKTLFETWFGGCTSREDLVHLNKDGYQYLQAALDIQYFKKYTNYATCSF